MGYDTEEGRRTADEQIRAFVGERLAAVPPGALDALGPNDRARYDRVLLRCEFLNRAAFGAFEEQLSEDRIAATLEADSQLKATASVLENPGAQPLDGALAKIEEALDRRDAAMAA